jgi:lysophospholipase L1-like esterase
MEILLRLAKFYFWPLRYDGWVTVMLRENRYVYDPVLLFKINPKAEWDCINRQGFRDTREYNERKKQGVFRIVCLGDSITFGSGVAPQDSYPKILETLLNKEGKTGFEVLNFGVPAYTSYQGLKLLQTYAMKYSPDLVVVGFLWNDIGGHRVSSKEDKYQRPAGFFVTEALKVLERSVFFQLLEKCMYIAQIKLKDNPQAETQWHRRVSLADSYENYREIISLLKQRKTACLIVIPPADVRMKYMPHYEAYVNKLKKVAEEFNITIVEPDGAFIAHPDDYFLDDGFHLNARGNTLVAKAIFSAIKMSKINSNCLYLEI